MATNSRSETPRDGGAKGFLTHTFSSFSNRNVRFIFLGTFFTSAGNWIQALTLGYMAYDLTENPVVVTTLLGSRSIPWLVIGPFAGVMIDTMDRRKVLLMSQVMRISLALVLGSIMILDLLQIWHLYVYIILNGIGWVMDNPTRQAITTASVPRESYQNALSLVQLAFSSARIIFPIVGGLVIAVLGSTTINIFVQAVCYSIVFFMFYPLKVERPSVQRKTERRVFGDLVDGFKYATHQPAILGLIILGLVPSFFLRPFEDSMLPVFADDVLKVGAIGLGLLMSSSSVGNLVGTLLMASFRNVRRKGIALIMTAIAAGVGLILLSQTEWIGFAATCLFFIGISMSMYHILSSTILMTITPDNYRGRVTTLFSMDLTGAPLGGLLAGGLALWLEVDWSMLVGGVTTVVLVLFISTIFKAIRTAADQPTSVEKESAAAG